MWTVCGFKQSRPGDWREYNELFGGIVVTSYAFSPTGIGEKSYGFGHFPAVLSGVIPVDFCSLRL